MDWASRRTLKKELRQRGTPVERFVGLNGFSAVLMWFVMFTFSVLVLIPVVELGGILTNSWSLRVAFIVPASAIICIWMARAVARLLLRTAPVRIDGRRRYGHIVWSSLWALYWSVCILDPLSSGTMSHKNTMLTSMAAIWGLASYMLVVIYWRGAPRPRNAVLFLRMFSGFSDRALTGVVFGAAGGHRTVVSLVTPFSTSGSWNPISLCFRGNPLFRPFAKMPIFSTADIDNWEQWVEKLIVEVDCVVIDVSSLTPGVETEIRLIRKYKDASQVVWTCEARNAKNLERLEQLVSTKYLQSDRVVIFRRSWWPAIPTMAVGAVVSFLAFARLGQVMQFLGSPGNLNLLVVYREILGWSNFHLALASILPTIVFLGVFAGRSIDVRSQLRLRSLIRGSRDDACSGSSAGSPSSSPASLSASR